MFASDLVFGLGLQGLGITAIHVDIQPCGMFGFVMIGLVRSKYNPCNAYVIHLQAWVPKPETPSPKP